MSDMTDQDPARPLAALREKAELLVELYRERANDIEADPALRNDVDASSLFRQAADMIDRLRAALWTDV